MKKRVESGRCGVQATEEHELMAELLFPASSQEVSLQ